MSQLKQAIYPVVHPLTKSFRPLLRDKTNRVDELVAVYPESQYQAVVDALSDSRFFRNTWLSSLKYCTVDDTQYFESDSFVWFENGPLSYGQVHVWIIPVEDEIRVYSHREWPIFRPVKHQSDDREAGDVTGVVAAVLP